MELGKLLKKSRNVYSQNGEDGIIECIFSIIGTANKLCCEFGAWDGVHLSNTKNLIDQGWGGILIEGDSERFKTLKQNFANNKNVVCLNCFVDDKDNSLHKLFKSNEYPLDLDFLSVDIDGLDYYIMKGMRINPRLICVEVNAGHSPSSSTLLSKKVAKDNVGQPLKAFVNLLDEKDFRLIAYNGNAFFLNKEVGYEKELPTVTSEHAYFEFLRNLPMEGKEWLYMVNKGWESPYYLYKNPSLSASKLKLSPLRVAKLWKKHSKKVMKTSRAR